MIKNFTLLVFVFFYVQIFSQEKKFSLIQLSDTLSNKEITKKSTKVLRNESKKNKKVKPYNPLAASKASFYSAILPGLGQAYSHKYWKIPFIYAALGTSVGIAIWNQKYYKQYRDAYKDRLLGIYDDEFLEYSNETLVALQENRQKNKEISILVSIGLYALNIIDANVTAHLQQFNLNNELTFKPKINFNELNKANYKLSLNYNF